MLIKGRDLTQRQREQVFSAYVHRHDAVGRGRYYPTDEAWLFDHAFYFIKNGSRLAANHRHCEPHYVADWSK